MPPRQKTTFKKGQKKGTTTYKDYSPEKERASSQLARFIRDNPAGDRRNLEQSPEVDVVTSMPVKFQKSFTNKNGILDIPNYSDMNSQQKYLFGIYDNVNKYQRDMNNLRTSSPEMAKAYAERFPKTNFAMNILPSAIPFVGPLFTADRAMKANKRKQEILNTPVNRPEGGFKNFVEFFKPKMNEEQTANTEIIEGEKEPLINPQDMNLQEARPFVSPQDMGFLDDENIFDSEKAAIEAGLAPGNVFNPVAADKQSKVDFINQVENTNYTVEDAEKTFAGYGQTIDDVFERSKQKQGGIIREEVNRDLNVDDEDPIPGGQFNLTSPTVDENTVPLILGGAGPDYDYTDFNVNQQLADVLPTDDILAQGNEKRSFVDDNYGKENPDIFVNDEKFDSSGLGFGFANGGSTNKYENMSTHEKLMRMAAEMYG
jgi:hypothetical protein